MADEDRAEDIRPVRVAAGEVLLEGELGVPDDARGVVLFAHGSGSSRRSVRNQAVAEELRARGLATLLMDLLTDEEEARDLRTAELRFDVDMLAHRVAGAISWLETATPELRVGLFGASTGAAAALIASALRPKAVGAIVSRGGRPDLATDALARVEAPTLLIVGGADSLVLDLNQQAYEEMRCTRELAIVPGATHLFEEPGALEEVARLAGDWFLRFLSRAPQKELRAAS